MPEILKKNNSNLFILLLLFYLIIIYSNTLHVPFMLDDRVNIIERPNLHLSKLTIDTVADTFFKTNGQERKLYRPISSLTIALNYYIGRYNVTGYHIVNLIIHLTTSIFLFKTLLLLLGLKKPNLTLNEIKFIAGLTTILWAAHPIQIQAVTYIIQRMASLATMFYIIGLWFYIKFRSYPDSANLFKKNQLLFFSCLFFLCAILSKENAAQFPIGILLIELFFFNGYENIKDNLVKTVCIVCVFLIISVLLYFYTDTLKGFFSPSSYILRPFTLSQRVFTEPGILIFYISQLLYPIPGRFSISHSFTLSDSLFSPLTTFIAIAGIVSLVIYALLKSKKYPLIGFPILFYFSHHIVESTTIPLELIYEHRNYLPTLFFFLPVAYGLVKLLSLYKNQNKLMFYLIVIFTSSIIFFIGLSTYIRNNDWQTHESLWKSAAKTAPDLIRPYAQLGWYHTSKNRLNTQKANFYFKQGLDKKNSYNIYEKVLLWINIARTYEHNNNTFETIKTLLISLNHVRGQIEKEPELINNTLTKDILANINFSLANNYFRLKDMSNAFYHINIALSFKKSPAFLNAKAKYLINGKEYHKANKLLQLSLKKNHDNWKTYFLLGETLTGTGNLSQGEWFYKQAQLKQ